MISSILDGRYLMAGSKEHTRLVGHALRREGKAFQKVGNQTWYVGGQMGYAVCECGATSALLDSTNGRKRWHKIIHKPAVREEMADDGSRTELEERS